MNYKIVIKKIQKKKWYELQNFKMLSAMYLSLQFKKDTTNVRHFISVKKMYVRMYNHKKHCNLMTYSPFSKFITVSKT